MILNTSNQQDSPIILGFASPSQLELLKTSEIWMADGVFECVSGVEADWSTSMWRIVPRSCNASSLMPYRTSSGFQSLLLWNAKYIDIEVDQSTLECKTLLQTKTKREEMVK